MIALLLFIFLVFYVVIQIPAVQNEVAKRVTTTLSAELNTTVRLRNISIEFFDKLVLEDFYIEDLRGDTLLYSGLLKANVNTGLTALLNRRLEIDEISLNNAVFQIHRDSGDARNNLGFIGDYFARPDTTVLAENTDKAPFFLDIKALYLNDIRFLKTDYYLGEDLEVYVPTGEILLNGLNLPENLIDIRTVSISNPVVRLNQYAWVDEEDKPDAPPSPIVVAVENVGIGAGQFILNNDRKTGSKLTDDNTLDLNYLRLYDIDLSVDSLRYHDWAVQGEIKGLTVKDRSGFTVNNLTAEEVKISERRTELNNLRLLTPDSDLGDTLVFKYRRYTDWRKFPDKVLIDARFRNAAKVRVGDIMAFVPALENNPFFRQNREEVVKIEGIISGKINNLRGRDLNISLAENTFLRGDFNSRNLTVKDEQYLDLRLDRLVTNMAVIKQIIPDFNPPENFYKLGNLDFKGEFNGFFTDFVAYGNLRTDLGRAELDMRMNIQEGREKARYSGGLSLFDFNLERWTDNANFGTVTFVSQVKNGVGLTGQTAKADLTAAIQNFTFKGYTYDNLDVSGNLSERFFSGDFKINDENVAFDFAGTVDFTRPKPLFDFSADVRKLALQPLNLAKENLILAGEVKQLYLEDTNISDIRGYARVRDFSIVHDGRDTFLIDTISIVSEVNADGSKRFFADSDPARAELLGDFDLSKIPLTFTRFFADNFPHYAQTFGVRPDTVLLLPPQQYTFDLVIKDSKNLNRLLHPGLGNLADITAQGYINTLTDSLEWDVRVPVFQFNNILISDINTYGKVKSGAGNLNLDVLETKLGKINLPPVKLLAITENDTLDFALNLISNYEMLDNVNLDGQVYPSGEFTELTINNSALVFLSDIWTIEPGNYLRFGNNRVEAQNFSLTSEGRRINLYTVGEKGLEVNAENFNLSFINELWTEDRFQLAGPFTFNLHADNIFKAEGLTLFVEADTFLINNDDWGVLRIDAEADNIKSKYNIYLNLYEDVSGRQLLAEGYYNPLNLEVPPGQVGMNKEVPNYLDVNFHLAEFPLYMLEYLIKEGITDTRGIIDADFRMHGKPKRLIMDGKAKVHDVAVTIDYLNTRYYADNQELTLRENEIDATGTFITDTLGNRAYLNGGLVHNYLRDWGLNVSAQSDNFVFLDTKKENNSLYYGYGIGAGLVEFTGTFRSTNIDITATTGPGTHLSIPISSAQDASEVSFIRFKEKKKLPPDTVEKEDNAQSGKIEGINLTMNLEATDAAVMKLIFDEQAGDIIEGRGNGNIRLDVPRGLDEFTMFGNYEITSGEYLFTLKNIVNKPFVVQRGGTIVWTGDPFGADINLTAEYKDLTAAPYNFIEEFLTGAPPEVQRLAGQATQVDLLLNLQGELLRPDISFAIDFPNLRGELKTFTDAKLRTIDRNPNELNRQVFGLIVAGQFLPSSSDLGSSGLAVGINTVTEMLSQQFSLYLTDLVSGWLENDGFISGIDFDIAYSRYEANTIDNVSGRANNELQVRLKNYLFNEKFAVYGGVNIDLDNEANPANPTQSGAFYAGDFAIEYFLTKDKQFKVRFYQSLQPELGGGRRNKTGLGLSYRKQFDTFQEFLAGMRKATKELKEG